MDPISAGTTLSCYAEIRGKTLAKEEICPLLNAIGFNRGIGKELGKGSFRYAESHNRPEVSMSVKKLEIPPLDPRCAYGLSPAYATAIKGACTQEAFPISHKILRKPVVTDRFTYEGKPRIIAASEDMNAVADSLTVCAFAFIAASLEEYTGIFNALTGMSYHAQNLMEIGNLITKRVYDKYYQYTKDTKEVEISQAVGLGKNIIL
jgi:aldehyde:ferredoxin oxidoreductase